MQRDDISLYLRTPEAALFLRISASSLEKLRVTGGGPRYMKLGKIVVYSQTDLAAWADARIRTSTSEPARVF